MNVRTPVKPSRQHRPTAPRGGPGAVAGGRRRRRPAPPGGDDQVGRPRRSLPTGFLLLVAVLVVLNLIGLVMVLSASSVDALEHQGSPCYYFAPAGVWTGLGAVGVPACTLRVDYRRLAAAGADPCSAVRSPCWCSCSCPASACNVKRRDPLARHRRLRRPAVGVPQAGRAASSAPTCSPRRSKRDGTTLGCTVRPVLCVFAGCRAAHPRPAEPRHDAGPRRHRVRGAVRRRPRRWPALRLRLRGRRGARPFVGVRHAATGVTGCSAFMDPSKDPLNTGYQTLQSYVGIASGGWSASGPGQQGEVGLPALGAHRLHLRRSSPRSSACSGPSLVVGLFVALGYLGVRVALRRPRPRSVACSPSASPTWFVRPGVREHRRGHRRAARSPA